LPEQSSGFADDAEQHTPPAFQPSGEFTLQRLQIDAHRVLFSERGQFHPHGVEPSLLR
jgi:hypothetical protein